MEGIDLNLLTKAEQALGADVSSGSDTGRVNAILRYIADSNKVILEIGQATNSLFANQQLNAQLIKTNFDSMSNMLDRIVELENTIEAIGSHLESHDSHLDSLGICIDAHSKHLEAHDELSDILFKRVDQLDNDS